MAATNYAAAFERTLEEFKKDLKKRDLDNFRNTTLEGLKQCIGDLQAKQHSSRRLQNLNRLKPFIEAMEQYGKVITVFANSTEIVAFVWGPMKFLLQVANSYAEAFTELLDTYEHIGELLPLLQKYEQLFHQKPHMIRVLALMFEDILKFHRLALRYFQQPLWKQLFEATWKTYKSKFGTIMSSMTRHRELIESTATVSQIEEFQEVQRIENEKFEARMKQEEMARYKAVKGWLRSADVYSDQYHFSKTRASNPGSGRWLLDCQAFQDWFDPQFPNIPALLWIAGIPGAGKTILASLVVEEAQKLSHAPAVLYFYCKNKDYERDSFVALARSMLSQILRYDHGLLHYFHQQSCHNTDANLESLSLIEELLAFAFQNCKAAYVIIDGLDECSTREERKHIVQWFRNLVEDLPISEPERIRCLFLSQDDGIARKDFSGMAKIRITKDDNHGDILQYCHARGEQLKYEKGLCEEKKESIVNAVATNADGMFLFAKLVWDNLLAQDTLQDLEEELLPEVFPTGLYSAYERIIHRIQEQRQHAKGNYAFKLLGWLACAKRPLKWYEIQGLQAIDLDEQSVSTNRRFLVEAKDLCASLVEHHEDERVEFVHSSIKLFLIERMTIDLTAEELRLANLCIDYLNLPALNGTSTHEGVHSGAYAFLDYAVIHWVRHLEAGLDQVAEDEPLLSDLTESLEIFVDQHWASPTAKFSASKKSTNRLKFFEELPFYDQLEMTIVSTRKQLTFHGRMRKEEIALDLAELTHRIRVALENVLTTSYDDDTINRLQNMYGTDIFKCPRFSCLSFHNGFATSQERDRHIDKHERPFRCNDQGCPASTFGFPTQKEHDKHMREMHHTQSDDNAQFPTDEEVAQSVQGKKAPEPETQPDPTPIVVQDPEPEPEQPIARVERLKRQKQTKQEHRCVHCSKLFTKKYNLDSHLKTHSKERPFKCSECDQAFARESDLWRHRAKHGEKEHICGGTLENGYSWGCGKSFSRADILSSHHKSKVGQKCVVSRHEQQNRLPIPQLSTGDPMGRARYSN